MYSHEDFASIFTFEKKIDKSSQMLNLSLGKNQGLRDLFAIMQLDGKNMTI